MDNLSVTLFSLNQKYTHTLEWQHMSVWADIVMGGIKEGAWRKVKLLKTNTFKIPYGYNKDSNRIDSYLN